MHAFFQIAVSFFPGYLTVQRQKGSEEAQGLHDSILPNVKTKIQSVCATTATTSDAVWMTDA